MKVSTIKFEVLGKLNVMLMATRWQWEERGLGYGLWPPDGAGIQQITPGFAKSFFKGRALWEMVSEAQGWPWRGMDWGYVGRGGSGEGAWAQVF